MKNEMKMSDLDSSGEMRNRHRRNRTPSPDSGVGDPDDRNSV